VKQLLAAVLIISFIVVLPGCKSSTPKPGSVPEALLPAPYCERAINVSLKADPKLNLYQNTAHTLLVCLYELRDPNAFNQLMDEPNGLAKLMECGRFDPSVAYVKRIVVQPGKQINETLDRAEGAKYLTLVAGYYVKDKERPYRLYRIPAGDCKESAMNLEVGLGPQAIRDAAKDGGGK
jgi:type VI secretion system VasD/TssJ family lipoprotein